ncbi:MAG: NADH-quinone oxidoreductase subunit M [Pseudomonadota bacterium]
MSWPVLSIVTFLPLVGVLFLLTIRDDEAATARNARWVALFTSGTTFVISLFILAGFDPDVAGFQMVEEVAWLPALGLTYKMGVDGISVWFVLLSTLLVPICIIASWDAIQHRVREYMIAFLVLETLMIGMFCALDLILFYILFEGVLIPMFLIIGIWGGARRVYAAFKFFLYTLLGSVLMLIAMLAMYWQAGTTDIEALLTHGFPSEMQYYLWLAFFASFAVKVPMWPVHTWLPDAHVEAPTAGSVILAGVLLKMGGYGLIRFSIPMFPEASDYFAPLVFAMSVIAVIYTSLIALAQSDMKKLIAYSSIAHMGFVTMGLFSMTPQGIEGAVFQMLSHGIVSGALFLCVGVVYDRLHTREIERYGGLVNNMPRYAVIFLTFTMASIGVPGTSGFVGEFLTLLGTFQVQNTVATLAATGLVLGAAYMLYLYRRVVFGKAPNDEVASLPDVSWREVAVFAPLLVLVFWMGIYPSTFLDLMSASVADLITNYELALMGTEAATQVADMPLDEAVGGGE